MDNLQFQFVCSVHPLLSELTFVVNEFFFSFFRMESLLDTSTDSDPLLDVGGLENFPSQENLVSFLLKLFSDLHSVLSCSLLILLFCLSVPSCYALVLILLPLAFFVE